MLDKNSIEVEYIIPRDNFMMRPLHKRHTYNIQGIYRLRDTAIVVAKADFTFFNVDAYLRFGGSIDLLFNSSEVPALRCLYEAFTLQNKSGAEACSVALSPKTIALAGPGFSAINNNLLFVRHIEVVKEYRGLMLSLHIINHAKEFVSHDTSLIALFPKPLAKYRGFEPMASPEELERSTRDREFYHRKLKAYFSSMGMIESGKGFMLGFIGQRRTTFAYS